MPVQGPNGNHYNTIYFSMIYKFTAPSEHALSNLRSGSLYCRHFEDYNDPFELWWNLENGLPPFDDDNERFKAAVAAWGFTGMKMNEIPLDRDTWDEFFGSLTDYEPSFTFTDTRITCFCSEAQNLLMWSHYADGLRGFCLEFDENELFVEDEYKYLVPVNYTDKPPHIDSFVYAVTHDQFEYAAEHGYEEYEGELRRKELNEIMRTAVASKLKEWSYEKETRLVIQTDGKDKTAIPYKYPSHSLKSIIIGEKMSPEFRSELKAVLESLDSPVNTRVALRSKESYTLTIHDMDL